MGGLSDTESSAVGARVLTDALLGDASERQIDRDRLADELRAWWARVAYDEVEQVVPKAVEYSAYDLVLIGQVMADTIGWKGDRDEGTMAELGCFFYLLGKVGRMAGAYREGRVPSFDTIHDCAVYTRMMRRVREVGAWPGRESQS